MDEIVSTKEKVILQKFISAEDERNVKKRIKEEMNKRKIENLIKLQEGQRKVNELQERLVEEYNRNKQREVLRTVKEKTSKLHDSIILHRKVIKQLIEQEAKLIRKPKRSVSKIDKLPYLRKFKQKMFESMQVSEGENSEDEGIDLSIPKFVLPLDMKSIKFKSVTPAPLKPKSYSPFKHSRH